MFEFIDIETINYYKKAEEKVILFFETPWCDECESFLAKITNSKDYLEGIPVYRVEMDLDGGDFIRKKFKIESTPTAILFSKGKEDKRTSSEELFSELLS